LIRRAVNVLAYAGAWWVYGLVAKGSQDVHFDMGEMVVWSHEFLLGTPKHPPLGAWLVRAWFSIMPTEPWAYYLFAMILATVALWTAWHISGRYLNAEKRVVGIVLLTAIIWRQNFRIPINSNMSCAKLDGPSMRTFALRARSRNISGPQCTIDPAERPSSLAIVGNSVSTPCNKRQ
jgi:hypothetical protein